MAKIISNMLFLIILLTLPLLFVLALILFSLNQKLFINELPNIIPKFSNNPTHPPFPKNLLESFNCGNLIQKYKSSKEIEEKKEIQLEITNVLKWFRLIKDEEILEMENNLNIFVENKSWAKMFGFLSFINIIWAISIIGLTISLLFIFKDIIYILGLIIFQFLYPLRNIAKFLLHPILYIISFLFIVQGKRYKKEDYIGLFFCLTGISISLVAFFYGVWLSLPFKEKRNNDEAKLYDFLSKKYLTILIILTYIYESHMLGFFSVMIFFAILGFSVLPLGLCWLIGWSSRNQMEKSIAVSFLLVQLNIFFKYYKKIYFYTRYFSLGLSIWGPICFFLGVLIKSSGYSWYYRNEYYKNNLLFIISIFEILFFGSILNLTSMVNTSLVFLVLYFVEKIGEFNFMFIKGFMGFWTFMFFIFGLLWWMSYFIKTHPKFIMEMFK